MFFPYNLRNIIISVLIITFDLTLKGNNDNWQMCFNIEFMNLNSRHYSDVYVYVLLSMKCLKTIKVLHLLYETSNKQNIFILCLL